jgi:selenocysteine lyase/cysteine desulfurase
VAGVNFRGGQRAPTVSFTLAGKQPEEICARLGSEGICAWDGHFYAIRPMEVLGLLERGGVTRVGVSLYTLEEEIDRLIATVRTIARS